MKLARIPIIAFALTYALSFWRPVHTNPPMVNKCPINELKVAVLLDPPFTTRPIPPKFADKGIMGELFDNIVTKCLISQCQQFSKNNYQVTLFNSTAKFLSTIQQNKTQVAYPISKPLKNFLEGDSYKGPHLNFEMFMKSTGYSLIMDVNNFNGKANELVFRTLLVNIWPIFVFTLLIAGISGIFVWMLETYFNEEEFPRSFTKGSYEGFWWAFVSMTTVGYGDKTPKFILGRLFGVVWILLGLVVIAMFTATATSALSISSTDFARVEDNRIGVLNHSSAELEAKKRGAKNVTVFSSVDSMYKELGHDNIDGILMDKYKAAYYLYEKDNLRFKVFENFNVEIPYDVALPATDVFKELMSPDSCFKQYLDKQDDDLLIQYLKPVKMYNFDSDSISVFSGESPATHKALLIILGVFLGLVFIGIIAEVIYRMVRKGKEKVQNGEDEIELKEVRVQHSAVANLKDVEVKLGQLVGEVGKLQEQLTVISSQANGSFGSGRNTTQM